MLLKISSALLLIFSALQSTAQVKPLTDEQYFKNDFKAMIKPLPAVTSWTDNSHFLLVRDGKTYIVDAATGKEREQTAADIKPDTAAVKPSVTIRNKDVVLRMRGEEIKLTNDTIVEKNPTLSPDGRYVAYTRNNDLYTVDITTKKETRITNDGSDVILNGYASWVYMEEILGRASNYRSFWWSPDSKHIAFFRTDDSPVPIFTITDGTGLHGYVETMRYPKVGDRNPEITVCMVSPAGGAITKADFNAKDDQYFGLPYWMPDGSALLVQWMNRKQNNLKIWKVDPATGAKTPFYDEMQKTWIDLDDQGDRLSFLKNGKGLLILSDESGWQHIYLHDLQGKRVNAVTSGKFTVTSLEYIDEKNSTVYFRARSRENTARSDFYRVDMNGKNLQRLTFGDFHHANINRSPDASYFVTTYQTASAPSKLALVNNKGKQIAELGNGALPGLNEYAIAKTEIIRVKSDDGIYELPMKVTWPANFDRSKKYPVLISIYGGPNAGTVMDTWSLSGTQQFYAKEGLIQVAMDHRASGHFGKEGVNYMYHDLGKWEIADYSTMVKWLIDNGSADKTKICITGFSYGGYMSCYALTYGNKVFTHGMAGGSVTDWQLYDSHYTERFMGTLADNPDGYQRSSVMSYTNNLTGKLQIVHGVIDDNVHLQNSMQLISKLQDQKKSFEFMIYPGGRHGWGGNKGLHFQNLKTEFIYKYLLEKPVPAQMMK